MASNMQTPPAAAPASDSEIEVMARNGIVRTEAFQYHVGGYRYTNLSDALAEVTRASRAEGRGA